MTKEQLLKEKIERYINTLNRNAEKSDDLAILKTIASDLFDIVQSTDNVDPKLLDKESK